jgi:myo-inositol 2-dehydrogenase/D-chiro-inositol 1-dehydrogenase
VTQPTSPPTETRRDFLATTAGLATASLVLPALTASVHAAGSDVLRVGLIGCGNRGTGAAEQALRADPNVKLVAVGDMFKDRLDDCLARLREKKDLAGRIDVKPDNCFLGFDAYKKVIDSGVDVVLLTAPPGFRPQHLKAAVDANKHIFCEKPMAVDGPGIRSILATVKESKKKNLSLVAGFCYRYQHVKREWMKRVHDGYIGDIVALQCTYNTGALWHRVREKGWDDMTWQLRNWPYFSWLSGDHIVEQAVHSLDKMAWAMRDQPPIKCVGTGGRQSRTSKEFGHIFDHHAVAYEYKNGVKMFHFCRQQLKCKSEVSDHIFGTLGSAHVMNQFGMHKINGKKPITIQRKPNDDMYQNEHDELFASIRSGKPINDGERMATSTLLAIMGRMATYTGQEITWEMALNSREDLMPAKLEFGKLDVAPVAQPGITEFV